MIKRMFVTVIIIFVSIINIHSEVQKISYRGWSECYKISNGSVEVIINPEAGGRILSFALNGSNVIFEDSTQNGKLLSDYRKKWFDVDGGRFDLGPEGATHKLHLLTWMGTWDAKIKGDNSVEIISQPDQRLGAQIKREFTLNKNSSLTIKQTVKNISDTTKSWFFWDRTLVPVGGKLVVPMNPESKYSQGWGIWEWDANNAIIHTDNISDPAVTTNDGNLLFEPTSSSPRGKYGTDSHDGWMAYGYKNVLFVKQQKYFPDKIYTEAGGQILIFFTSGKFMEIEPVSPTTTLKPGDSYSFSANWWLFPYQTTKINPEHLDDVSKFVNSKTYIDQ